MRYKIILYGLSNGLFQLDSIVLNYRPTEQAAEDARALFGAKSYLIVEV